MAETLPPTATSTVETRQRNPACDKLRRLSAGAPRPGGHEYQDKGVVIRRKNPAGIKIHDPDPSLSGCGGLVDFGRFARGHGVDAELARRFGGVKVGLNVVYPMPDILRTLIDAQVAGGSRVFDLERLGADPLFRELAGGDVPSVDTFYRDLERFDDGMLRSLEELMSREGLKILTVTAPRAIHVDIDTSVEPLFSEQREGAVPGYNPNYRGRPSYHPILARVPEIGNLCVGALLRPGNTTLGAADVPTIRDWLRRVRAAVGRRCQVTVRIDSAGGFTELIHMTQEEEIQAYVLCKGRLMPDLRAAVTLVPAKSWQTTEEGVDGEALEQAAVVPFARADWSTLKVPVRVIAVRSKERAAGGSDYLWEELEYSARVYLTTDPHLALDEVAPRYDGRAGIEPYIAEQKNDWGLGDVPSSAFHANHAMFLLKLYASNLFTVYANRKLPQASRWKTAWKRSALIQIPARILRGGGRLAIRCATAVERLLAPVTVPPAVVPSS